MRRKIGYSSIALGSLWLVSLIFFTTTVPFFPAILFPTGLLVIGGLCLRRGRVIEE